MATIGFIGLGNMGLPMARNLAKAGHAVQGFDVVEGARKALAADGARVAATVAAAAHGAEIVVTMLPAGAHVREVYQGAGGVLASAARGALLIDCSTIDVASARAVARSAADAGCEMLDAPVSGGTAGAAGGTLTFMVGGSEAGFARAQPVLQAMGRNVLHAGSAGAGQAAKICNNLMLGIGMIATAEGFLLAEKLGLDAQKLFDISSKSSGQSWSMTSYCPVPGPVPTAPSNRDYAPGFTAAMMLKDLRLAADAAHESGAISPLGSLAEQLYGLYVNGGAGGSDFSGIIRMLRAKNTPAK